MLHSFVILHVSLQADVRPELVRLQWSRQQLLELQVGDSVAAQYKREGRWLGARIAKVWPAERRGGSGAGSGSGPRLTSGPWFDLYYDDDRTEAKVDGGYRLLPPEQVDTGANADAVVEEGSVEEDEVAHGGAEDSEEAASDPGVMRCDERRRSVCLRPGCEREARFGGRGGRSRPF